MLIPKLETVVVFGENLSTIFVVRLMFKLIVFRLEPDVEYQTCFEFCDDRTLKISAIVHFLVESYTIFNSVRSAVQATR
jgi:hypothetical protein